MNRFTAFSAAALAGFWMWKNARNNTPPKIPTPGRPKDFTTRLLETGSTLLQAKSPLNAFNLYLDGFHFYADDMGRQIEAHHYCAAITEEFHQCLIFDGNTRHARLVGIEYIISERLFRGLPDEEKKLWHSHQYEVKSGTLIGPGLPVAAEHELMKKMVTTYGKTWHTWHSEHDELPLGIPALMMGFTDDNQIQLSLIDDRDRRFGIATADRRENRQDIPMPEVAPGANVWQSGSSPQLELHMHEMHRAERQHA